MPEVSETSQALGRSGEAWLMSIFKGFCRVKAREPLVIPASPSAGWRAQTGERKKLPACSLWHLTSPQRPWTKGSDPSGSHSNYCPITQRCPLHGMPSPGAFLCCMLFQHTPPRIHHVPLCHHIDFRTQPLTKGTASAYSLLSNFQSLSCPFCPLDPGALSITSLSPFSFFF